MPIFWIILIALAAVMCGIGIFYVVRKVQLSQRISHVYQLNLHGVPLIRALLYACVAEKNLFLDTTYLQKNKQSGLYYQVPISAIAITRGGVLIFQYLQTAEKVLTTEGTQWTLKNQNAISAIPNPFSRMELQARTLLSMLKQTRLEQVPIHAYVVLLNDRTQVLQPREDLIFPSDIPATIKRYNRSKLISSFHLRKIAAMLKNYQYTPQPPQQKIKEQPT